MTKRKTPADWIEEIQPCPFCGGPGSARSEMTYGRNEWYGYWIHRRRCPLHFSDPSVDASTLPRLVRKMNRRANDE